MATSYYGFTISPNQLETGEGFLICRNVPLARTGEQDYLGTEIGLDTDKIVKVMRSEEEVFSPEAIASFEGKPVTNDHPPILLDPDNAGLYEKGHVQNVRRGVGEWADFLVGDLHIHDAQLIADIKNGKREVSCGYEVEYDEADGGYKQTKIRGNHVAVVDTARAGHKAAIMDSIQSKPQKAERKKKMSKKSTFFKIFGQAANGKSDDELTQLAMDAADVMTEETVEEKVEEETKDADPLKGEIEALKKAVDSLTARMDALEKPEKEEIEEEIAEEVVDEEESVVVPAEEMDGCGTAADDLLSVLNAIQDENKRKAVSDALENILNASKTHAEKAKVMDAEELQNVYAQMNPHTRKEA